MARTTPGFTDIYHDAYCDGYRTFYQEGAGSVRVVKRPDQYGQLIEGMLLESSGTNYCLYSSNINSWPTKSNVTTPSSITGPLHGFPAYAFVESSDGGAVQHSITGASNATGSTDGQICFYQFIMAPADRSWVEISIYSNGLQQSIYIDLANKVFGNIDVGTFTDKWFDSDVGTFGGKVFKHFVLKYTSSGGAGNKNIVIKSANANGGKSYTGNGSTCFYLAHAQLEIGANLDHFSSPIITTTATVTRTTDSTIVYDYSNLLNQDSKVFDFLKSTVPSAGISIFSITDGTDNNKIYAYVDTNGYLNAEVISGGVSQGTAQIATNICNDEKKRIAVRWNSTNLDILIYDYHTQTIEIDISSVLSIPSDLTTDNFLVADHIIGKSKNLGYYERNNKKLLFY